MKLQSNISSMATLRTEESGRCGEVTTILYIHVSQKANHKPPNADPVLWSAHVPQCYIVRNTRLAQMMYKMTCSSHRYQQFQFNGFDLQVQLNISVAENLRVRFFTKQINPRSFGSWCIKGTEKSASRVDSSVPLTHHDPRYLGLICLVRKRKIRFQILSD